MQTFYQCCNVVCLRSGIKKVRRHGNCFEISGTSLKSIFFSIANFFGAAIILTPKTHAYSCKYSVIRFNAIAV